MASRLLQADRASVTIAPPPARFVLPAGLPATADFLPAQQLFAMFEHNGAGDLIDALLGAMDTFDGGADLERDLSDLEDGDTDPCAAGDDDVSKGPCIFGGGVGLLGDRDDAENGHDVQQSVTIIDGGSDAT